MFLGSSGEAPVDYASPLRPECLAETPPQAVRHQVVPYPASLAAPRRDAAVAVLWLYFPPALLFLPRLPSARLLWSRSYCMIGLILFISRDHVRQ